MPTPVGNKQLSVSFLTIGGIFSIFRRKMDGPNPSKMDTKVLNPAPTSHFQRQLISLFGENENEN